MESSRRLERQEKKRMFCRKERRERSKSGRSMREEEEGTTREKFHGRATGEQGPREKEQKRDKRQRDGH